jgi:GT2 family glycosyltransferase
MPQDALARPAASLVIASTDRWDDLFACLTAVLATSRDVPHEVIVVDDGSRDATRVGLPHLDGVRHVRNNWPVGPALARNQGAAVALGDTLVFLDDRARPEPGWLGALLAVCGPASAVQVAAPRLVGPGGMPWAAAIAIDGPAGGDAPPGARAVIAVAPEAVAVQAEAFRAAGGFDGGFQGGGEVADLCLRARERGGLVVEVQGSVVACAAPPPSAGAVNHDEGRLCARWPALLGDSAPSAPSAPSEGAPPEATHAAPVRAAPGAGEPIVSIVIPAFNKWPLTYHCLSSLLQNTQGAHHETIVVDNASTDETATALPQLAGIRVHRNAENLGFAAACNQGAHLSRGRYLLFLNNDTEALPDWLAPMLRMMESDPKMAVVGSKLLFPDGALQHGGLAVHYAAPLPIQPVHMGYRESPEASTVPLHLSAVTAACMLVRRDVFEAVGGFDESYRNGCEDVDLCFKVRERGWLVGYAPGSVLYHHESQSEGRFSAAPHNENLLQRRWMGRFKSFDVDRRRAPAPAPPRAGRPPVSVVLPVKDGIRGIAPCLEDLAANLGARDQIVVADADSRDCTLQFVDGFALEHPGLVRIAETGPACDLPGAARAGVAVALNAVVVVLPRLVGMPPGFLDGLLADLEKSPHALAVLPLGDRGFVLGGERERIAALLDLAPGAIFAADAHALAQAAARTTTSGTTATIVTATSGPAAMPSPGPRSAAAIAGRGRSVRVP